ncbi:hypothetical protein MHU86_21298 [Fragilaria crotonensis]|nr:hypothetical protein MHU86_21298 [Fragilaria crotonensis]
MMATETQAANDDDDHADGWFFPMDKPKYHTYIASLMRFAHGRQTPYPNTKIFTREEMIAVTPMQVRNWMCMKAFGKTAIVSTDRPLRCRGNTLAQMKKCSSHYFPNKLSQWMDGKGNPTKSQYRSRIQKEVWLHEDFKRLADEDDEDGVGTHSYRKFPSTYARSNGCSPDEIEIRGRWKQQGQRVVFRYIDVKQLFIDAKVAAALCIGGPIKYELSVDVEMKSFRRNFLLCCRESSNAWEALRLQAAVANNNPVHRVPLHVYRINDTLCIDPVVVQREEGGAPGVPATNAGGHGNQQQRDNDSYQALLIQLQHQRQQMTGMEQRIDGSLNSFRTWTRSQFTIINNNIRRFGGSIQGGLARQDPAQALERRAAANQQMDAVENEIGGGYYVSLSPAPKTLYELHTEWQFGIGGRKPARLWNLRERAKRAGGVKQKFYRRSVVWKLINGLVNRGCHVQEAIHMIKEAYGHNCTVSQYIDKIIKDRQNGGHPNLR